MGYTTLPGNGLPSRPLRSSARALVLSCVLAGVLATPALADNPTASGTAAPASIPFNASTLLTVTVNPATSPASTGLAVTADLSSIGGSPAATLFDDGSNGDVTASDNVFSLSFTPLTIPGTKTLPVTVTDAQSRTAGATITLTVTAPANVFAVNSSADGPVDAGGCVSPAVCTLRDAVAAANAASGDSEITVPAAHYVLNPGASPLGELALTNPTAVVGAGTRTTIVDANHLSRVFAVNTTGGPALLLSGLTVTGGATPTLPPESTDPGDGGGVFTLSRLALDHVAITGNVAAAGGGGVMNGTIHSGSTPPPASFNAVTIANNQVTGGAVNGQGGGAVVATALALVNSTIASNSASNPGTNEGGGLLSTNGVATLLNDTITGNSAANPAASGDFGGGISGDTLTPNPPINLPFLSVLQATNTIVSGNSTDGAEHNCDLLGTTNATSSHNIEGDASCNFGDAGTQQTTAIKLGPLQDNGGPTNTLLPMSDSPAIDKAAPTGCPATDQRGAIRPAGSACDVGAAELAPPSATTGPATGVSQTAATLTGSASNPAVATGAATFQYGLSIAYGQSAAGGSVAGASAASTPSAALTGLIPNTVYHYRLVVTTTDGQAIGSDAMFTTPAVPPTPPTPPTPPNKPPVPKHCASLRLISFHFKHLVFGSLQLSVNGFRVRPVVRLTGRHHIPTLLVDLRGAPRGNVLIQISGRQRTKHHGTRRFSQKRLFHTCVPGPH